MISVCLATYNGEKYISEQLASLLPQLGADDEVIISDDGSTDNTVAIAAAMDSRIRILHHKREHEAFFLDYSTRNFEFALRHAKGDFIFLCDQDDVWLPNKVERMVADLRDNDYWISICDCKTCNDDLSVYQESYFDANATSLSLPRLLLRFRMMGCCMAVRRELLNIAIPFPKTKVGHDIWLVLLAQHYGKAHMLREQLHLYRRHANSVTSAGKKSNLSLWTKIYYRFTLIAVYLKWLCGARLKPNGLTLQ